MLNIHYIKIRWCIGLTNSPTDLFTYQNSKVLPEVLESYKFAYI